MILRTLRKYTKIFNNYYCKLHVKSVPVNETVDVYRNVDVYVYVTTCVHMIILESKKKKECPVTFN